MASTQHARPRPLPPIPNCLAIALQAAFCELLGAAASYGYMMLLIRDVDALRPDDIIPLDEAEKVGHGGVWGGSMVRGIRNVC